MWVAQCLEYDLAAQGSSIREAQAAFERLFVAQLTVSLEQGVQPFEHLKPAPERYERMFDHALALKEPARFSVPPERIPRSAATVPPWMLRALAELRLNG